MHELFAQVLEHKDLSKAGDLFSVEDSDIVDDLSNVLIKIKEISAASDYLRNDNDQSVVEICITRVTSSIRETGSIENHVGAMVTLLQSCLKHDLKPSSKDEDPPHAKIASDIMSSLFLNYSKKTVMAQALPVAVRFLHQGNKELSRNLSSYLSLAAIDNAALLAEHIEPIIASIIAGNRQLSRVLPQIYAENKIPVNKKVGDLVQLLDKSDLTEKNSLLQLFDLIAKEKPELLEPHIPDLCKFLSTPTTSSTVLQTFVTMVTTNPRPFESHVTVLKKTAEQQPATLSLVANIIAALGKLNKAQARNSLDYLTSKLEGADSSTLPVLLKEIKVVSEAHPGGLLGDYMAEIGKYSTSNSSTARLLVEQLKECHSKEKGVGEKEFKSTSCQTEGTVTVITVGGPAGAVSGSNIKLITPSSRALGTSKNTPATATTATTTAAATDTVNVTGNAVTVVTSGATVLQNTSVTTGSKVVSPSLSETKLKSRPGSAATTTSTHSAASSTATGVSNATGQSIPFPDTVHQFCEKHHDKIKTFINNVSARLPVPIKCNLEDAKHHKRETRLFFICLGRGTNCLYSQSFFSMRTRLPRIWIHLMFLAIQSRHQSAVSVTDPSVGNLKAVWDGLRLDSGSSFVRLVTSSFPSTKDQDALREELNSVRFFDVFEFNAAQNYWACFLCNHPERATGLLQDGLPVIEGQLKEKKGKWKFFKRWKTRYFTLSGAQITYNKNDSKKEALPVCRIQSVKAIRKGMRDLPKAFEIFTDDQKYVFKAKDSHHAEQWVQCLQIAVARSQKKEMPPIEIKEIEKAVTTPAATGPETQTRL